MRRYIRLAALLATAALLLCACGAVPQAAPATPLAEPPAASPAPTPAPAPEPSSTPTPEPTPEPGFVRSSGVKEDGSFDAGALFIGDSHTYYLLQYLMGADKLGEARYMAICGMSMPFFFNGVDMPLGDGFSVRNASVCSPEFVGLSYGEAVAAAGEDARAIYFMLGTNLSMEVTTEDYTALWSYILEQCPNATLYVQTIPYSPLSDWPRVNDCIREAAAGFDERVVVVDSHSAIPREEILSDNIHYSVYAMEPWYEYLTASVRAAAEEKP